MRKIIKAILYASPFFGTYLKLRTCHFAGFSFWRYLYFTFFTIDKSIYWPRFKSCVVFAPWNITIGINCSIGNKGCYIQGNGKLIIGNYVRIGPNVGILSGNHDIYNHFKQDRRVTIIGDYTWIGMNSVILPGVVLGPRTVVGAGAVVTKSFPEGYCVIGGNPANHLKIIDKEKFIPYIAKYEFYGYIPKDKFEKFKNRHFKKIDS